MCGIAGYIGKTPNKDSLRLIQVLLSGIRQRGPDDEGVCIIHRSKRKMHVCRSGRTVEALSAVLSHIEVEATRSEHDAALIHTRYAVIDLSTGGHQPFVSQDGTLAVIFNGEIYNYLELKDELTKNGIRFKTNSDTEVLVEGYRFWGHDLWAKMNGFWAVALYDLREDVIVLSRDRIGVAPLYYREKDGTFFFASYIEPLIDISPADIAVNRDVYIGFLQTGLKDYDNSTYYAQIKSVPAGSFMCFRSGQQVYAEAEIGRFWNLPERRFSASEISFDQAVKTFRDLLFDAVDLRLRSDVKIGFELSGGLDSSSIVAAAAQLSKESIATYTARIKGADEEPFAAMMLKRYKLDYRVLEDIENNFSRDCRTFSRVMEEPYDNPNVYTHHHMLRQMKREGINVVITGAGGDEVLAGYEASFWPKAYQELRSQGLLSYAAADWYEFCRRFKTVKVAQETIRHYLLDPWKRFVKRKPSAVVQPGACAKAEEYRNGYYRSSFFEQRLYHFRIGLIPYYMRSSDHFTMGIPVEHRFPMLDYRLVEFGLKLPTEYLFKNGWTKYILRKAMEPYLPPGITWRRRKMGFAFPYRQYFTARSSVFKPCLEGLYEQDEGLRRYGSYDFLSDKDPTLLWRLLSTAIWQEASGHRPL